MAFTATFYDGETTARHEVMLEVRSTALGISGNTIENVNWEYGSLKASNKVAPGSELRLYKINNPGARLIIPPGRASEMVCEKAPHLSASFNIKGVVNAAGWVMVIVLVVVGVLYGLLTLAPKSLAGLIPREWRDQVGKQTEDTMVKSAKLCNNPAGQRALLKLAGKVASGSKSPPDFSVRVYNMKLMNAFAVAGGRIVLTRGLIKEAQSPGEVAGILAHELGHVAHRHPEEAIVRVMGLQFLISVVTGGGDGEMIGNLAGFATLMSYSREAERSADIFADNILKTAKIDSSGLIEFFKRVKKVEDKIISNEKVKSLFSMLSSHPGTQERIAKLKPLPKSVAIKVLTPLEWQALKNICDKTSKGNEA